MRREREPPKYNGKNDIRDYLIQFEMIAEINEWDNEECGLHLATSLLADACDVLKLIPSELKRDYMSIQKALLERYCPEGREAMFTVELWNRVCKKGEKVATFGHEMRKLAKEAYPHAMLHEQILVNLYVKGLPNKEMRRHVHLSRPKTLNDHFGN
jgi:hypothetical protein